MSSDVDELTRLREDHDPRTIPQMKAEDRYQQGTITEAKQVEDHWSLTWREDGDRAGSIGCSCPNKEGVTVRPGDTIRIHGEGFGSPFHGIDINDTEMFWLTPFERFAERIGRLARHDREQRERYAIEKDRLDATYAALSEPMKGRINRFRAAEPDFRVKSEGYEIFACSQSDAFAARAREAADAREGQHEVDAWFASGEFEKEHPAQAERPARELTQAVRWLLWWSKLPYERQRELMPAMNDGHSGNTFGAAWFYAIRLLLGEDV
jgi:hypothetical protein